MALGIIEGNYLYDIGNALRSKMNVQNTFSPAEMAGAILNINGGGEANLGTKLIIANGLYNAVDDDFDGYSAVNVQVPVTSYNSGELNAVVNGIYNADDYGFDGFNTVNIAVPIPSYSFGDISVTQNGVYNAADSGYNGFNSVTVEVPPTVYNSGSLTVNTNGTYNASDYSLDGFNSVTVDVPPQIVITNNDSTPPSDTNVLWVYPDTMQDLSEVSY